MNIRPTKFFFGVGFAWLAFALISNSLAFFALPDDALAVKIFSLQNWLILTAFIFIFGSIDAWLIKLAAPIRVERKVSSTLPVDRWTPIEIKLHHSLKHETEILLCDQYPEQSQIENLPQRVKLKPGMISKIFYRFKPIERGNLKFSKIMLFRKSPLQFWEYKQCLGEDITVKIYPNFAAISDYILLALDNHTSQLGIRKKQRRGEGQDFHQLREYRQGDSLRQIDWKASSRKQKLISKEYQDERDQDIIFMLDSGRHMRSQDDELSHFDHALNSMLLLSYIALKQGDAVGLMTFGSGKPRWLAPAKGIHHVNTLLNTVYDLQPTTHATDYPQAAQDLKIFQRKRALIIFLSNVRDENIDDLLPAMKLLRRQHLLLLANLREQILDDSLKQPIQDIESAFVYSGVQLYLTQRHRIDEQLSNAHIMTLDVTPKQLPIFLVNRYFDIKRRGEL